MKVLSSICIVLLIVLMAPSRGRAEEAGPDKDTDAAGETEGQEAEPIEEDELEAVITPLEQYIQALEAFAPGDRMRAVRALGELGDTAAYEPLARIARTDTVPEVRAWAIRMVYRFSTPQALDLVREVESQDPDPRVRETASVLLGTRVGSTESVDQEETEHSTRGGMSDPGGLSFGVVHIGLGILNLWVGLYFTLNGFTPALIPVSFGVGALIIGIPLTIVYAVRLVRRRRVPTMGIRLLGERHS